nr:cation:proton antiporter [uncultured Pseudogulbenkiania sp.]
MHATSFIHDLAVIMLIAGLVTVLFHRLRQPVVLGYIVAGVIIGPYTPPFALIQDEATVKTLAELGVVFLMFSLGLEFSLKKLASVGVTALLAALTEIVAMVAIGFQIGKYFGWATMDSVFLGAMLAISSTTIIVKALDELGLKNERFAQMIFGILIVEDILAIGMIALLSGIAISGRVEAGAVLSTLGQLSLFMVVALVLGILIVPRLLAYVARFESREMLLVTVLGLCFGFCLLVLQLEYSIALGAFLIGAIMAESRELKQIEHLVEPIRDMFSAIFFVAIGLLLDPAVLLQYAWPIALITVAVVVGKVVTCSLGTFVAGNDGRTAMRVGMGLAQIGEFSFIIAALGLSLKVTSDFLYPVAVAVSALTTLFTPYLIRAAEPFAGLVNRLAPEPVKRGLGYYTAWLQSIQPQEERAELLAIVRRIVLHVLVNLCLVTAIFLAAAYFGPEWLAGRGDTRLVNALLWSVALLLSVPFLVAIYRKLKALAMLLAELSVRPEMAGQLTTASRRVIAELIPVGALIGILLFLSALCVSILPPSEVLLVIVLAVGAVAVLFWKRLIQLHSRLQIALYETMHPPAP